MVCDDDIQIRLNDWPCVNAVSGDSEEVVVRYVSRNLGILLELIVSQRCNRYAKD